MTSHDATPEPPLVSLNGRPYLHVAGLAVTLPGTDPQNKLLHLVFFVVVVVYVFVCIVYQAVLMCSHGVFGRQRSSYCRLVGSLTQDAQHIPSLDLGPLHTVRCVAGWMIIR